MDLSASQRSMCATILVGCGNLRLSLVTLNTENPRWVRMIRNNFDTIQESLTGSNTSVREAVNSWDKIKENLDEGLPKNAAIGEDVMYLFVATDEAFYALLSTLDINIEPDINLTEA
jgi:NADH/NAD ratio-sensing transcriptional regulator Rex